MRPQGYHRGAPCSGRRGERFKPQGITLAVPVLTLVLALAEPDARRRLDSPLAPPGTQWCHESRYGSY